MKLCLALVPGLLALSACQAGGSGVSNAVAVPPGAALDIAAPTRPARPNPAAGPSPGAVISVDCAGATFQLRSGEADHATRPALLMGAKAAATVVSGPAELADYDPVGLACVTSMKTGGQWLAVQYGEVEGGCGFCEWVHLYDAQGRLLTRSNPPILSDETRPPAQRQSPNNREFTRLSEELRLERPEFQFLPRE